VKTTEALTIRKSDGRAKIKVTLSTGLGRLHFVQAANALHEAGVDLTVIQGWIPSKLLTDSVIDKLGTLIGSPGLSVGMNKRRLEFLPTGRNIGLAWPEIILTLLLITNRKIRISRGSASSIGWHLFGKASQRHLNSPEVFHVRSGAGGGGAIQTARKNGAKIIVDHSIAHPDFLQSTLQQEFLRAGRPIWFSTENPFWEQVINDCKNTDVLLVNSHFVKSTFVERGFDPNKIVVSYLGVRKDFFGLKKQYDIKDERIQLLFTGQFGLRKGARYLIEGLEMLAKQGIDFRLTVLGDASEAQQFIKKSKISDRVQLLGFIPQDALKSYLTASDIYVFPSLGEGSASSAMEAMAAGLPVVSTLETGLPAIHGKDALIIPAKDPTAIRDALLKLATDEHLRRRLGQTAAKKISQSYRWSDYGRNVTTLYQAITRETDSIFLNPLK